MRVGILIPAYQPTQVLYGLIERLVSLLGNQETRHDIVVIDDGSDNPESLAILSRLSAFSEITILKHQENLGKGAALKTGFQFARDNDYDFIVTADADGQHDAKDIIAVMEDTKARDQFVIGTRNFEANVPLRSRLGNIITRIFFRLIFRTNLSDTQSGLRGIPKHFFPTLLSIPHNKYQFEFEALVKISAQEEIHEHPIKTIYEEGNLSSHFRPIIDSALIYFVLLRHVFFTFCISVADVVGFFILSSFISATVAFITVRVITVILYFFIVRNVVFRSSGRLLIQSVKFIALVLINIFIIGLVLSQVEKSLAIAPLLVYLLSSLALFGFNFLAHRYVIFRD